MTKENNSKIKLAISRLKHSWSKESTNDNLSTKEMLGYTSAAMGQNFWWGLKGYMMIFYTLIMGLGMKEIGIMFLIVGIWDAVNDPIMGAIVDKTNTKWGKLRPYLLWTAAPIGILTFSLLYNPSFLDKGGKLVYVYVTYILWEMCYTISDVPFAALPGAMTSNTIQRTKLITFSQYGSNLGLVVPGVLPFFLAMVDPSRHGMIYTSVALVLSLLGAIMFSSAFFFVKERVPASPDKYKVKESLKLISKSKPTILCYVSQFMDFIQHAASGTAYFFFFFAFLNGTGLSFLPKIFPGHEGLGLMSLLGVVMGVPTFIAMAFTPKIAKYVEMRTIKLFAGLIRASSLIIAFLIGFDEPWKLILMIVIFMFANIPQDMTGIATKNMFLDSLDYLEYKTGKRAEGLLFSVGGFIVKIKFSIASFITAMLLAAIGVKTELLEGLEGEAYTSALLGLADSINIKALFALYTLVPAAGMILTIIPIYFYDLVGDKKKKIMEELKEMRIEKAKKLGIDVENIQDMEQLKEKLLEMNLEKDDKKL